MLEIRTADMCEDCRPHEGTGGFPKFSLGGGLGGERIGWGSGFAGQGDFPKHSMTGGFSKTFDDRGIFQNIR